MNIYPRYKQGNTRKIQNNEEFTQNDENILNDASTLWS